MPIVAFSPQPGFIGKWENNGVLDRTVNVWENCNLSISLDPLE